MKKSMSIRGKFSSDFDSKKSRDRNNSDEDSDVIYEPFKLVLVSTLE